MPAVGRGLQGVPAPRRDRHPRAPSAASSEAGSSRGRSEVGLQWKIPTVEN